MDQVQTDIMSYMQQSNTKYFSTADIISATKLPMKKVREALHAMVVEQQLKREHATNCAVHYYIPGKVFNTAPKIDRAYTKPLEGYTKKLLAHKELCMLVNRR
ncbi:hypothetical protein ACO0LG_08575 [Undibacterium sp. Ji42W]|uniref:hypothetical protein n=1 Tax=Undibacterium sp. Ji42W TaxID=3413039 RepID=UPI003BF35CBF